MKLNDAQEAMLVHIRQAAKRFRDAKAHEYEIARQQAEARIRDFELEMQKAVAEGHRAGIPFNQLAKRGMGVQNGTTAKEAAEAGLPFLDDAAENATPEAANATPSQRYDFDAEHSRLTVTFAPEDFDGKIPGITEAQTLAFFVDGANLTPEGEDYSHPVARLALTPDGRKDIAAYLDSID